ncbi:two-component hybrid sensor and regulator [Calothrix sp. NIES-2100]|uniref:ATP-binding sensor histidine kinase n=1 Tax=Calothrix sp. NIES-2100 TaxID=1954172 RepID=UPI000B60EE60|nr:two-component hybrid sensor and regulator [Calothrix sp. NIES-2100]
MVSTLVKIPGYQVREELYNGSRTLVYRAVRESDRQPVVLKLLKNPYPSFHELVQFRNQYNIAKNLHYPLIIQIYSIEAYQNAYMLVMEDFGGISLKEMGDIASLEEFLQVAIALCNILDILYRDRIIHKDIKPSNILINPQTKQVKLIDFSIASLLPRETQSLISPNLLEGTLAYISPEQTGRMNRLIDYRTDFYSLGVTFYELLTGELPFKSNDPMELVHCHIAQLPKPIPSENIPQVLSDIVMKLMDKNAEDRYQSTLGIKFDLEKCLEQLTATGKIEHFKIAQRDLCDRFMIPDKLYGREADIKILLQAFDRVSQGATEMMLVAGFSGIGKTAVVNELHKPIVRQRGYFIKGKFDQFNRNIPFSAFFQAFRDLIGQLLTESDPQIQSWKSKILAALGDNAQVIIEVIPELEIIIAQQPPVPELSGTAAQNRFNLLFQKFTQVFTSSEHPLVIFLDDLQWADSASLKLMQLLMADTEHLLLMGAYRDHEVNPAHPLMLTLSEISKTKAKVNTITLAPLNEIQINKLVADTLKCHENLAWNLSKLVFQKTQGNPFFATQFLKALHQDKLIQFNFDLGCWECDITQVVQQAVTDDVVAFMSFQLRRLPTATQNILQLAACIGNQFDLATLAIISQQSEVEASADLWKALQSGLILPQSEVYKFFVGDKHQDFTKKNQGIFTYKFLHDRVQQAAYALIPEAQRQSTHLHIGKLWLHSTPDIEKEERIFEIVNQLNIGKALIIEPVEISQLAKLNLLTGIKAKAATAYIAAVEYLQTGWQLLPAESWQNQYELTLALNTAIAEASYLSGDFENMEEYANIVLQNSRSFLEQVHVYNTKIQACMAKSNHLEALQTALLVLHRLGVELPDQPNQQDIVQAMEQTSLLLADKSVADLLTLPEMEDETILAAMQILSSIISTAYQAAPFLFRLIVIKQVQLSIIYGNAPESTYAYATYGLIIFAALGDINTAYELGQVALDLIEKLNAVKLKSKTLFAVNCFIRHWKDHLRETLNPLLEAYTCGLEHGDIEYAAMSAYVFSRYAYLSGQELHDLESTIGNYGKVIFQLKQTTYVNFNNIYHQSVLNLLGMVDNPRYLIGESYDETKMLPLHYAANQVSIICQVHFCKLLLCNLFYDYKQALENAAIVEKYLASITGLVLIPNFYFYESLTRLALYSDTSLTEQEALLSRVTENLAKLKSWAQYAPMNHQHKVDLVSAEKCRVLGEKIDAIQLYEQAIAGAKANEYIHEEALSNELTAKFYLEWGKEKVAQVYMLEAYYCYARWGAKAKTDDLEKRYPQLLEPILQPRHIKLNPLETIATITSSKTLKSTWTSSTDSKSVSDLLDLTSAIKGAQAISSSIKLDELIINLTQIILENSGAKKAVLILPQANIWQVRAVVFINHESPDRYEKIINIQESIDTCRLIPRKIINYVKNTQKTVAIDNCQTDIPEIISEYILTNQPKSVLCTPIIKQGNLVGILYLENKITAGVFTQERLQVINLLSSQAAISLENAQLYQQAQQALQDLQQAQVQIVQSEKMSALGNLVAGVAHEMNNPLGFIAASLKQAQPTIADITEHLKLYQESFPNPAEEITEHAEAIDLEYSLEDLPKIINSMTMACDRLKNISMSLRIFSRADKDYKVPFNIHQGIDSTILILKHRLKANEQRPAIEVLTNYGDLPAIECFPGQLNQVFMNILANAIDALEEANTGHSYAEISANPNKIIITTSREDNLVKIAIADNAQGMSEEVKQKIFDHLFTTKAVGKGTGLGLAIARQIITEKHRGSLTCESVLGLGTEFSITIPITDNKY